MIVVEVSIQVEQAKPSAYGVRCCLVCEHDQSIEHEIEFALPLSLLLLWYKTFRAWMTADLSSFIAVATEDDPSLIVELHDSSILSPLKPKFVT